MVKVILIEDDQQMMQLLNTLLKLEGFEVVSGIENHDILEFVKYNDPDLIMLDVHLRMGGGKEINGFDLLKQIRSDELVKDKKVIISSGLDFRVESREAGADGFILKPYMPDDLIGMIKNLVG